MLQNCTSPRKMCDVCCVIKYSDKECCSDWTVMITIYYYIKNETENKALIITLGFVNLRYMY